MALFEKVLAKYVPKDPAEKAEAGSTLSRLKGVHEHLADIMSFAEDLGVLGALEKASPWAEAATETLGEALPPIKILLKAFSKLTAIDDPGDLGYLAATLAYQRAVEQALPEILGNKRGSAKLRKRAIKELREATPEEAYKFDRFSFRSALQHQFVTDADRFLEFSAENLGLDEAGFRKLQQQVHMRFVPNLKGVLSHGKTSDQFAPFRELIVLDTLEGRAFDALLEHADYQRWMFEERPVLGREPFTLSEVYVDTDCGALSWKEIKGKGHQAGRSNQGRERIDPFLEKNGGRRPLVDTVLGLIADEDFKDAIVLQGVAGSGKSSLTLRLAWELVRQGLNPIRIELKHLDTSESASVEEALPEAVRITSTERTPEANELVFGKSLFFENSIFNESVRFRGAKICPYVLILDGWDEISVGASEGYRQQLERMLAGLRQQFLKNRAHPVRVILTGRPTDAVEASKFLRDETQLLTVRNLSPDQLESYFGKVGVATEAAIERGNGSWNLQQVEVLPKVLERFRREYSAKEEKDRQGKTESAGSSSLEILGLPLLAHLSLRLLAERPQDAENILEDTTSLFRSLVDLVIGQAGKAADPTFDVDGTAMLQGKNLRRLLRRTAEAMTLTGAESISHDELEVRLGLEEDELGQQIECLSGQQVLSRLMISFFFKGGRKELGAEFSHKSFREYLFAEQVVEELKSYGRLTTSDLPERVRQRYWKDFEDGDPRRQLCHRLAELFGPVWITPEVSLHIRRLLNWEIFRACRQDPPLGQPTERLSLEEWERVRDGLAQAWDWWGEGVHLRPQPSRNPDLPVYQHLEPVALKVAKGVRLRSKPRVLPVPPRVTTIDAHLGDGLFLVTASIHSWLAADRGVSTDQSPKDYCLSTGPLRYQVGDYQRSKSVTFFAPSAPVGIYFYNYCARINAGGYRPLGPFPSRAYLARAYLFGAYLRGADFRGADLMGAVFADANLCGADFREADLRGADLRGALLGGADLRGADLRGASLKGVKELKRWQINGALGNAATELPFDLGRPGNWR